MPCLERQILVITMSRLVAYSFVTSSEIDQIRPTLTKAARSRKFFFTRIAQNIRPYWTIILPKFLNITSLRDPIPVQHTPAVRHFTPNFTFVAAACCVCRAKTQNDWPLSKCNTGNLSCGQYFRPVITHMESCVFPAGWCRNHAVSVKRANPWQRIDNVYNCRRLALLIDQLIRVVKRDPSSTYCRRINVSRFGVTKPHIWILS